MEGLVKGDIIVVPFPFSDLRSEKRRPALIIKVPAGGDIIALQITGESYEKDIEIPIISGDFSQGKLSRVSYVRLDKVSSIEKFLVRYKAGHLKQEKFNEIIDKLVNYLKL